MKRVSDFCRLYHSDADPDILAEALAESYYSPTPPMMCFVTLDENNVIVSHALLTIDDYYGKVTVNILQYWKDRGIRYGKETYDDFFKLATSWAKANNAELIRMTARNRAVADVLAKHGFTDSGRVVMTRPLDGQ